MMLIDCENTWSATESNGEAYGTRVTA